MPVQKRSRVASFALTTLASAVIGAAILPPAYAAGLGKLTVLSALGQPLRAEIELTAVTPEEAADLSAKLAPAEAFRAANIDFNPALLNLRFDIEQRNGTRVIRVTSTQPINEPFVDMLLELTWANGRLVREYTFLLDPADMRGTQAPQVAAPVDVNRAAAQAGAPVQQPARPQAAQPAPAAPAERADAAARDDVRVKRGDTLSGIASDIKPADVSLDMMLVALYRANPEAFSGNNMNRLKSGKILAVPDAETVRNTGRAEARGIVVAHAADFNAYRARLAGQVESSTPAKAPEPQQSAGGKITAKVEERPNAVNAAQDQLKLSKAGEASGKAGQTGGAEDKIAKDQQVADAAARVKELEKNVSDLEKLMAVQSQGGTEAQNRAAVPEMDAKGAPVAAAPQPLSPAQPAADKPAAKAAAKPAVKAPPAQPEPGIMDVVMENIQAIGIALAALLAGIGLIAVRRRKAAEALVVRQDTVVPPEPGSHTQALFAEPGGQSIDTSNSVFNSNFAPSASQLDTNEVDPVAEADVYIAYGRDAQAEEILKEALRTHPDRHAVRLKLLEIYANRKDVRAFEGQANELYALTRGHGDEWAQAAALGRTIDAGNPLYGEQGGAGPLAAAAAAAGAAALATDERANDFGALLDDASRSRADDTAYGDAADLDLTQAPVPATAVNAVDFDFGDATATPAPSATPVAPAPADNLADFDFGDTTAQPDTPAPTIVAEAADKDHLLDFDLGGLGFEPTPPATTAERAEREAQAAADDLDLTLDEPVTPAPAPADLAMDFDLDLPGESQAAAAHAPDTTAEEAAQEEAARDPLAELDLMDFDLPPSTPPAGAGTQPATTPALADEQDFGLPELPDLPPSQPPVTAPPPPEFDLSGIDLDLDETAAPRETAVADEPAYAPAPAAAAAAPLTPLQMEMDTKLDLAVAYQEIGDKEGARELLDEVLRGGSDEQVARANDMLAQLG